MTDIISNKIIDHLEREKLAMSNHTNRITNNIEKEIKIITIHYQISRYVYWFISIAYKKEVTIIIL